MFHLGKKATVQIPDWDGRVAVKMHHLGQVKSYMANEIKLLSRQRKVSETLAPVMALMDDDSLDEWGFDVIGLQENLLAHDAELLPSLGLRLFQRHEVAQKLGIEPRRIKSFLHKIESLYSPLPYHNAMHGADVMRTIHYFLVATTLEDILSPLEKFAALFAGAVHDVKHPGMFTVSKVLPHCTSQQSQVITTSFCAKHLMLLQLLTMILPRLRTCTAPQLSR